MKSEEKRPGFPLRGSCRAATDEVLSPPPERGLPETGSATSSALRAPSPQGEGKARCLRPLVAVAVPVFALLACRWLLRGGGLYCLFREVTGLYCPGCGSGRAALALLHGHVGAALRYNPLVFLLGLPSGALLAWEYLRFVFPGLHLKKPVLPRWAGDAALALIMAFWLLRNLPGFAFLAP